MRFELRCGLIGAYLAAACGSHGAAPGVPANDGVLYLEAAGFRRSELEASLVNPSNGYSQLRLEHYDSGEAGDWSALPEYNPPVDVLAATELDGPGGVNVSTLSPQTAPLALPKGVASEIDPELVALGREAFHRYPVQLAPYWSVALTSRAAAARYGLWVDATKGAGGVVRARMADGTGELMVTCSTCHSAPAGGGIEDGLPNAQLDTGAARLAASGIADENNPVAAWGPGRLDVTTAAGTEPVRIPDLRPTRWLTYLQADGTVRVPDLTTLAIRIETLIVTSHNQATRPPRVVALGLASYLVSLSGGLPPPSRAAIVSPRGAELFASNCAGCHGGDGYTGSPVLLATIGTDPTVGESADRTTGAYRVPSLRGVGTRGPLLHDGTLPSLASMFDPARVSEGFGARLHGSGPVPGHPYGLALPDADRAAITQYLGSL